MKRITKAELLTIPARIRDIDKQRSRVEAMRAKLLSPRGLDTNEKVQTSGGEAAALADIVIDMEQALEKDLNELNGLREETAAIIQELPAELKILMRLRYLDSEDGAPVCRSWPTIADVMFYSPPTVYRKHDEALALLFPEEAEE